MIPGLRKWWRETRASFWFAPALIVLGAVALAAGLIAIDANVAPQSNPQWPLIFGAGASGSRSLLTAVGAPEMGYIESIEGEELLALARKHGAVVRMERGIGEFVAAGAPLVSLAGPGKPEEVTADELRKIYVIGRHRTVEQDAGFGIRQLVDIGMKALSPGVNDTTTAVMCVDYLGAIIARLAARGMPASHRLEGSELRVIARGPSFASLLGQAFDQLRQNAGGNAAVLERQLQALEIVAGHTLHAGRRQALGRQAALIASAARASIPSAYDRAGCEAASLRFSKSLAGP